MSEKALVRTLKLYSGLSSVAHTWVLQTKHCLQNRVSPPLPSQMALTSRSTSICPYVSDTLGYLTTYLYETKYRPLMFIAAEETKTGISFQR